MAGVEPRATGRGTVPPKPWCLVVSRSGGGEFQREGAQEFKPRLGDEVVIFDSHATLEFWSVEGWLDGDDISYFKRVIPVWVQVWRFMNRKPNAMPEMA